MKRYANTISSLLKYSTGVFMIVLSTVLYDTMSHIITLMGNQADIMSAFDTCQECRHIFWVASISLIILSGILLILRFIDDATDYLPVSIMWALSGAYMLKLIYIPRRFLILISFILFIWWFIERQRQVGRELGSLQVFMPSVIFAISITDNPLVHMFGIFFSIFMEGIFLMIQATSEFSYNMLSFKANIPAKIDISNLNFLQQTLTLQIAILWPLIPMSVLAIVPQEPLQVYVRYATNILTLLYGFSFILLSVAIYKIHKTSGKLLFATFLMESIFVSIGVIFHQSFIAIIGAITAFGIVSYTGVYIENMLRAQLGVIGFDKYFDITMSGILIYIVTIMALPWDIVLQYFLSFEPIMVWSTVLTAKLIFLGILLSTAYKPLTNIRYISQRHISALQ